MTSAEPPENAGPAAPEPAGGDAKPKSQPILNAPAAVSWLVVAIVAVHAVRFVAPEYLDDWLVTTFAFDASVYTDPGARAARPLTAVFGPVTHMLLHAGPAHLLVNMAMLLAFGTAIARRMGAGWFFALFLFSTVSGAAGWLILNPHSPGLVIGASGAVSGMMGAIARLGLARRAMPGGPLPFRDRRTALYVAAAWIVINLIFGALGPGLFGLEGGIAWEAHLGGFIAGFLAIGWLDGRGRARTGHGE
jgi:membrane associated rhomboid family serine protease